MKGPLTADEPKFLVLHQHLYVRQKIGCPQVPKLINTALNVATNKKLLPEYHLSTLVI